MSSYGQPQLFVLSRKKPRNHRKCRVVVNGTEILRSLCSHEHTTMSTMGKEGQRINQ